MAGSPASWGAAFSLKECRPLENGYEAFETLFARNAREFESAQLDGPVILDPGMKK
jgi:hypothetical protein